jgi:hypothetical protein
LDRSAGSSRRAASSSTPREYRLVQGRDGDPGHETQVVARVRRVPGHDFMPVDRERHKAASERGSATAGDDSSHGARIAHRIGRCSARTRNITVLPRAGRSSAEARRALRASRLASPARWAPWTHAQPRAVIPPSAAPSTTSGRALWYGCNSIAPWEADASATRRIRDPGIPLLMQSTSWKRYHAR